MKHLMKWIGFLIIIALVTTPIHIAWAEEGDDTDPPELTGSTPDNGDTDIAANQTIQLNFSENIHLSGLPDTGTFTGTGSDPITVEGDSGYTGSTYTVSGSTVSLEGNWGAEDGAEVTVTVAAGAVADEATPTPNANTGAFTVRFHLKDVTGPTVTDTDPADNATNVASDKTLTITYDEAIQQGENWDDVAVTKGGESVDVTTDISGNEVHITPDNPEGKWDDGVGATYTLTIPDGAIADAKGNAAGATSITFTTTDSTAPTLTGSDPADNATDVAGNKTIALQFSEDIHLARLPDTGTFTGTADDPITVANGSTYKGSSYTVTDNTIRLSGTWGSEDGSAVTVAVKAGQVMDTSNNPSAQAFTFSFTLNDAGPTVVSSDPANNATGVASDKVLVITYNEALQQGANWSGLAVTAGATSIPITTEISGNTLRITPNNTDLKWDNGIGVTYSVSVPAGAVQDLNGNDAGQSTLTFKTIDTTAPTLASSNPANGASGMNSRQEIDLIFSEKITYTPGFTGDRIIVKKGDTRITCYSGIDNNTLWIMSTSSWGNDGSTITITINAGAYSDTSSNPILQNYTLTYTLNDIVLPHVTVFDPANNAINVPSDKVLTLTYNEPIQQSINWDLITVTSGTTTIPVDAEITGNNQLQITAKNPDHKWDDGIIGISYVLTIPADAVKDMNNNSGYLSTLSFRTTDTTAPTLSSSTPVNGAVNISRTQTIQLNFSENIRLTRSPSSTSGSFYYWNYDTEPITVKRGNTYYSTNYTISGNTIQLAGSWGTTDGSAIIVTVKSGAIIDIASNPNISNETTTFYLTDTTGPSIISSDPANNATNVQSNKAITVSFNEPIQIGEDVSSIYVTFRDNNYNQSTVPINISINGSALIITPNTPSGKWDNGMGGHYTLFIPTKAVKDMNNNNYSSYTYIYYHTQHTIVPSIKSISPTYGASGLDTNFSALVTFDEDIIQGANFCSINSSCNGVPRTLNIRPDGKYLRITDYNGWQYGCTYQVNIPSGAINCSFGVPYTKPITLRFSIKQKPVALSLYKTPPEAIVAGNSVTLYYNIDKASNMRLDVLNSSGGTVKTLTKNNAKPGKGSIKWTSAKWKYGKFTLRLTATPVDTKTASAGVIDKTVYTLAKADVAITSYTKTWNVRTSRFTVTFRCNTACYIRFTWKKGSKIYGAQGEYYPDAEGVVTYDTASFSGLSSMKGGSYTFKIYVNNGVSSDSASKTVKIVN